MKYLRFLVTLLLISGPLSAGPVFFTECCSRPPCSFISWRGDCCVPQYTLYADFLYWQIHPDGLEFARSGGVAPNSTTEVETGDILSPGCRAHPGLRIGFVVDIAPCCGGWEGYVQYTYLKNSIVNSAEVEFGVEGLHPLLWNLGASGEEDINFTKGRWQHEINTLDVGLGNRFCVHPCFSFTPYLGLKTTWQKLRYVVTYENFVNTTVKSQDQVCFVTDFNGIGLRSGLSAEFKLCRCLSIIGNFAMSAIYSELNTNRRDDHIDNLLSGSSQAIANVWFNWEHCTFIPVTELLVGICWDIPFVCGYDYHIMVGWDAQVWWNMMQYILISNNTVGNAFEFGARGNITYQGLTARLGVSF